MKDRTTVLVNKNLSIPDETQTIFQRGEMMFRLSEAKYQTRNNE